MLPTKIVKNFLSDSESDFVKQYLIQNGSCIVDNKTNFSKFAKYKDIHNTFWAWDYDNDENLKNILNRKLDTLLNKKVKAINAHLLESNIPYYVHNDSFQIEDEGRIPEYTVILSLDSYNAKTIIFNEYTDTFNSIDSNLFSNYKKNYNQEKKLKIDSRFCYENLSHIDIDDLKCLSVETVFDWDKGSLVIFDRKKFHCSSDFLSQGLVSKVGIVLWTVY